MDKIGEGANWKQPFFIEQKTNPNNAARHPPLGTERSRMGFKSLNPISHKTPLLKTVPREYS
jgi:hypothetical protein